MAHNAISTRQMPNDMQSETALLGSILLRPPCLYDVIDKLQPGDFYRASHRRIYEAILSLSDLKESIDVISLSDKLEKRGELEQIGGMDYLSELSEAVPTSHNVKAYAKIIREKAIHRESIEHLWSAIEDHYTESETAKTVINGTIDGLIKISEGQKNAESIEPASDIAKDKRLRTYFESFQSGDNGPLETGFIDLDNLINFVPGNLMVIAARPALGKSSMAKDIISHATSNGFTAAVITLEMTKAEWLARIVLPRSGESYYTLRDKTADFDRIDNEIKSLSERALYISDYGNATVEGIYGQIKSLVAKNKKPDLIVIDYLQLIRPPKWSLRQGREVQVAAISKALKNLAKDTNSRVIALSQLNRKVEDRSGPALIPRLEDIRESGAIEQDADIIIGFTRIEYYQERDGEHVDLENQGVAQCALLKSRGGKTGRFDLRWDGPQTTFSNLSKMEY